MMIGQAHGDSPFDSHSCLKQNIREVMIQRTVEI